MAYAFFNYLGRVKCKISVFCVVKSSFLSKKSYLHCCLCDVLLRNLKASCEVIRSDPDIIENSIGDCRKNFDGVLCETYFIIYHR